MAEKSENGMKYRIFVEIYFVIYPYAILLIH